MDESVEMSPGFLPVSGTAAKPAIHEPCWRLLRSAGSHLSALLTLSRWQFWPVGALPAAVGATLASSPWSWWHIAGVGMIFGPCVGGAAEALNDYCDRDTDSLKHLKSCRGVCLSGGTGVLLRSEVSPLVALALASVLFAAAIVGAWFIQGTPLAVMVILSCMLGIAYSSRPVRLKERGLWGPLAVGLGFGGFALSGGYASIAGTLDWSISVRGAAAALTITGLFLTHQLSDFVVDSQRKLRVTTVLLGYRRTRYLSAGLTFLGLICQSAIVIAIGGNPAILAALSVLGAFVAFRVLQDRITTATRLVAIAGQALACGAYV